MQYSMNDSAGESTPFVRYLPVNNRGRDFVVGDLHGERTLLDKFLAYIHFNPEQDRVLSVGDLVDRGPDSVATLALIREPWFYAVKGNHEYMVLECLEEYQREGEPLWASAQHALNGGEWLNEHFDKDWRLKSESPLQALLPYLKRLPLVIVVGQGTLARYNVVHAEFPEFLIDQHLDEAALWQDVESLEKTIIWSRRIMGSDKWRGAAMRPGLSVTYCGHTVDSEIRQRDSHVCLDTGACLPFFSPDTRGEGFGLSIADPRSGEIWRVDAESLYITHAWCRSA